MEQRAAKVVIVIVLGVWDSQAKLSFDLQFNYFPTEGAFVLILREN